MKSIVIETSFIIFLFTQIGSYISCYHYQVQTTTGSTTI